MSDAVLVRDSQEGVGLISNICASSNDREVDVVGRANIAEIELCGRELTAKKYSSFSRTIFIPTVTSGVTISTFS